MLSPVDTFRALRAAEHLARDVVTQVEPRPGGQASASLRLAAVIGLARARANWSRKSLRTPPLLVTMPDGVCLVP
jgi:hypothetical protein